MRRASIAGRRESFRCPIPLKIQQRVNTEVRPYPCCSNRCMVICTMPHVILSAIGGDRPGLVEEVSQFAFSRGGNIEDSRMVNLRGQFAMMVLLAGEEPTIARLRADLPELSKQTS